MSEGTSEKRGIFRRLFRRETEDTLVAEKALAVEDGPEKAEELRTAEPQGSPFGKETPEDAEEVVTLKRGLQKTRSGFIRNLDQLLLGKKRIDEQIASSLEEILVTADIGVKTAYELLDNVAERVKRKELDDSEAILRHLKGLVLEILQRVESPLRIQSEGRPFVVMVVGVNGSGKTTTIAKIAAHHKAAGRKVLLAAADTFRAAAVEQMEIWAQRVGCSVVKGKEKADPSSVAYEAVEQALSDGSDLVLVDTAGRFHTRVPLMEQLKKIRKTLEKKLPGAPHETLLVIDSSNGQNAILQATTFNEAIPVTGIALTKLDGTSKGGVLVGISNELKIPVRYVGIGEKMGDLRPFNAHDFVEALFAGSEVTGKE
jgi:fused signal recognition particle receptor